MRALAISSAGARSLLFVRNLVPRRVTLSGAAEWFSPKDAPAGGRSNYDHEEAKSSRS
jgi:hypothetical protein